MGDYLIFIYSQGGLPVKCCLHLSSVVMHVFHNWPIKCAVRKQTWSWSIAKVNVFYCWWLERKRLNEITESMSVLVNLAGNQKPHLAMQFLLVRRLRQNPNGILNPGRESAHGTSQCIELLNLLYPTGLLPQQPTAKVLNPVGTRCPEVTSWPLWS
jgi:hypothetical protein